MNTKRFLVFVVACLIPMAARAQNQDQEALRKNLFRSYYFDYADRNPTAFVRHRMAIADPRALQTFRAIDDRTAALEEVFRALPDVSVSFDVGVFSVSAGSQQLAALRNLVARTPLGAGLVSPEVTDRALREYTQNNWLELSETADFVYESMRGNLLLPNVPGLTPEQVALLKQEFAADAAADDRLPNPNEPLESLLLHAPAGFDRAARALDATKTAEQIAALRADLPALRTFIQEQLQGLPTDAELRELLGGVAGELMDVRTFVDEQRRAQRRVETFKDMHAGVDLLSAFLQFVDPPTARRFSAIAHQTIIAAEAVSTMAVAGALSLTGVGAVVAAAIVVVELLQQSGPSAEEQMQQLLLEIYHSIMIELAAIRRGLFEIRTQLAAIDARIAELAADTRIGFNRLELALASVSTTLHGLALESNRFFETASVDPAQSAHAAVVDLMTNPANADRRITLSNPGSPASADVQRHLSRMAQLGLEDSKEPPFSQESPLNGRDVFATDRPRIVENRVGDLPNLAPLLASEGATVRRRLFGGLSHPVALAQSVAWFVDARDRLPRPAATDQNFALLCNEAKRLATASAEARTLTPFALKLVAKTAERTKGQIDSQLQAQRRVDIDLLTRSAAEPLPEDPAQRIDAALADAPGGGFVVQMWTVASPLSSATRPPMAEERTRLGVPAGQEVTALAGCVVMALVAYDRPPFIRRDALGVKSFFSAERLAVRQKRRLCADEHPVAAFPAANLAAALEAAAAANAASLPEEPLTPDEIVRNTVGLQHVTDFLTRKRGERIAARAVDSGVITVPPSPRRENRVRQLCEPQPGRLEPQVVCRSHGCVRFHREAFWAPETGLPVNEVAWELGIDAVCMPAEGVLNSQIERIVDEAVASQQFIRVPLSLNGVAGKVERLEAAAAEVHRRREKDFIDVWSDRLSAPGDPLRRSIDDLRLARYALEAFARFGFGACGDPAEVLHDALTLVTCGKSAACSKAPDDALVQGTDFIAISEAAALVAEMVNLRGQGERLLQALANAPSPASCASAGPYGMSDAFALLNGLARRSPVFLPDGCRSDVFNP